MLEWTEAPMNSPYLGLAATAGALFVVLVIFATFVVPYLTAVQTAIESIGR